MSFVVSGIKTIKAPRPTWHELIINPEIIIDRMKNAGWYIIHNYNTHAGYDVWLCDGNILTSNIPRNVFQALLLLNIIYKSQENHNIYLLNEKAIK